MANPDANAELECNPNNSWAPSGADQGDLDAELPVERDMIEQPADSNRRMSPSGQPVTPTKPKTSPPLNPISFAGNDWDDSTSQPTSLPMPEVAQSNNGPRSASASGAEWQLYPEGSDALFKELFPDPKLGKPFELQEAFAAMYMKQEHLERRFEHWVHYLMEHLQQRLAVEISEQLHGGGYRPWMNKAATPPSQAGGRLPSQRNHVSLRRKSNARQKSVTGSEQAANVAKLGSIPEKPADGVVPVEPAFSRVDSTGAGVSKVDSVRADGTVAQKKASIQEDLLEISQQMDQYKDDAARRDQLRKKYKSKSRRGKGKSVKSQAYFEDETILAKIVHSPMFDGTAAMMILLNSVLIGVTVEYTTKNETEAPWMENCSLVCNIYFFVELIMRMSLQGFHYFTSDEKTWNIFDFILVAFSVIDFVMSKLGGGAASVGSGMKTIKMLRIVRIFRVFRFFRELSLLALMIADSIKSLMWALLMLTIIIYVFAICFTQTCSDFLRVQRDDTTVEPVLIQMTFEQFGSLPKTIYFLILSMLSGISWGEVSDTLMEVDSFSAFLFFFYIFFTLLAVLNIITGVFVDNAVETARTQRDFLAQKELELREKYVAEMRELFHEMDEDGSGTVSWEEMDDHFSDARVRGYFAALGIDPDDMSRLFQLIDDDNSGEVEVDEFLDGCLRLKGEAKSIDVHTVLHECRKVHNRLEDVLVYFGWVDTETPSAQQRTRGYGSRESGPTTSTTSTA